MKQICLTRRSHNQSRLGPLSRPNRVRPRRDPLGAGLHALGAGLSTSPKLATAGLPVCEPNSPGRETFGLERVRGRRPAHSKWRPADSKGRPAHSSSRGGFTLIEMMVVITILVFLLASVGIALGTLFRAQSELQDELIAANTTSRLAAQLHADAHLASAAEITREGTTTRVRFLLPNAEINYVTHPRRIVRTVVQGETESHREVFSLLEGTTATWELTAERPAFITLTTSFVSPALRASVARPREQRIETSIGLHTGDAR